MQNPQIILVKIYRPSKLQKSDKNVSNVLWNVGIINRDEPTANQVAPFNPRDQSHAELYQARIGTKFDSISSRLSSWAPNTLKFITRGNNDILWAAPGP